MLNRTKKQDFIAVEEAFFNIKRKSNVDASIRSIQRVIEREFAQTVDIHIVENTSNEFFGMTVYPASNMIDTFVYSIINRKDNYYMEFWKDIKYWTIEIDSLLLYDTRLNANPQEITAVLLHEIGHTIYSNEIPQRLNRVFNYEFLKLNYRLRKLVLWNKAVDLLGLNVLNACGIKNYRSKMLKKEKYADDLAVKYGYGTNLADFLDKLIVVSGNSLIDRTEKELDNEVKTLVMWTVDNITELEIRKTKLRKSLKIEALSNSSTVIRDYIKKIQKSFFGAVEAGEPTPVTESYVVEQMVINQYRKILNEGFMDLFTKTGKLKKINQTDIDIIRVEIGRIQNEDDKIYVLNLIYNEMELINMGLDLIAEKKSNKVPMSKDRLVNFKKQLEEMRRQVLSLELDNKEYSIMVKYPKGYEG